MTNFGFSTNLQNRPKAKIGLLVLQSDETLEHEFHQMFDPQEVCLMVSRVPSSAHVSAQSLAAMERQITHAAKLLPPPIFFDAIGYGCTSASAVIGSQKVADLVTAGCQTDKVSDPLCALVAACRALSINSLAFLSPYVKEVSDTLRQSLAQEGIKTPAFGSFNEAEETMVANIDEASLVSAAAALGQDARTDAVFLSCTNLKTLALLDKVRAQINKPVLSSNLVLAWHLAKLSGVRLKNAALNF